MIVNLYKFKVLFTDKRILPRFMNAENSEEVIIYFNNKFSGKIYSVENIGLIGSRIK